MSRPALLLSAIAFAALSSRANLASADSALCGPALLRALGDHAQHVFAPKSNRLGAVVTLPPGKTAQALGLEPFVEGYARLHGRPADLLAYADTHPDLRIELAPPVHTLLDQASQFIRSSDARQVLGVDGSGVLVGVADTGLDVSLPDVRDPKTGKSRVAWILDLSLPPAGKYPDVERKFCVKDATGVCQLGAVLQGRDIDALLAKPSNGTIPIDEYGHGTHVTSIAAGNGGPAGIYVGGAPNAKIVFARVVRTRYDPSYTIENDDLLTGVAFLFDRAEAMKLPMAANLSIGTDFGPHDGSLSWEKSIASFVGENAPGRLMAVAAGNSGSIVLSPIHQTVQVLPGATLSVPVPAPASAGGTIQIWLTFAGAASVSVGLDGPDGTWIAPVSPGQTGNYDGAGYTASIANGSSASQISGANIPSGSNGAVVVWDANAAPGFPAGTYAITLQGSGTADLWLSTGLLLPNGNAVGFTDGVREGTINLPATQPGVISVGCTVNHVMWTDIDGGAWGVTNSPALDPSGGLPADGGGPSFFPGKVCWFSSAGPTVTGVPKPEISAPGAFVIAAMSGQAPPTGAESIFNAQGTCGADEDCYEVDPQHAVAEGTSMSAPMVTGALALLLEREPTLTQSRAVPVLQGGAHFFRDGPILFEDQGGPGELDVVGAFAALELMSHPEKSLPAPAPSSWITLSTDYVLADGSTPTTAIVELRTAEGAPADLFEASRLQPVALVGGAQLDPPPTLSRRGPGVWTFAVQPPPGLGGQAMTFGATFDGKPIVAPRSIPIATDPWTADYASSAGSGASCGLAGRAPRERGAWLSWATALVLMALRRRRSPSSHEARAPRR